MHCRRGKDIRTVSSFCCNFSRTYTHRRHHTCRIHGCHIGIVARPFQLFIVSLLGSDCHLQLQTVSMHQCKFIGKAQATDFKRSNMHCRRGRNPLHPSWNNGDNSISYFVGSDDTRFFIYTCHLSITAAPTQRIIISIFWIHCTIQRFAFSLYNSNFLRQRQ